MKPELESLKRQLAESSLEAEKLASDLDDGQWRWSPAAEVWPAGACIAHLNETNRLYIAAIRKMIEDRSPVPSADVSFRYGMLERWFVKSMEPPPKFKMKAPKSFVPITVPSRVEALAEWRRIHTELMTLIERADALHLSRNKVISPVNRFIKLSLGMAFALVAAHNRRHIYQAKETVAEQAKRAGASQW